MEFKDAWKEQEELNKLGQKINQLQAYRLYMYGYNQAVNKFENQYLDKPKVKEAIRKQMSDCTCQGGDCPACEDNIMLNRILKELGE